MSRLLLLLSCALLVISGMPLEAKLPEIDAKSARDKIKEIMQNHAIHKELSAELVKRTLGIYLEEVDPLKSYLIEEEIDAWLNPSETLIYEILSDYQKGSFAIFEAIDDKMRSVIERHRELEAEYGKGPTPTDVRYEEFKDMPWTKNVEELKTRIFRIRSLQVETARKLNQELQTQSLQRIAKRQAKFEEQFLNTNPIERERNTLTLVIKAVASSLDTHTVYFTPEEARQFLINVQQRLFGIGAQLRDDLNGFTIVKIIDGGPAAKNKQLKVKDRIVAVNGEAVVGMDIADAVELIRGEENTPVILTIIRTEGEGENKKEIQLDISLARGEVVLKETRYDVTFEPFGDGGIACLRLHSFYQDPEFSSAGDLARELEALKKDHRIYGVILDLRYNSGGMLTQAVSVTGLFITKGIVVSVKDENNHIQHLRDLDQQMAWDGPLMVLINRASASASEIVAKTLQDYGRALIVGDDHSYGKGSYQSFTLNTSSYGGVNPQGEFKVTRGRYYTVSGKTPQLEGVLSDIVVPGAASTAEIGEKYSKYPLPNDQIPPNFNDDLSDVPFIQRSRLQFFYRTNLQTKHSWDPQLLKTLRANSSYRIEHDKDYQLFLKELKDKDKKEEIDEEQPAELKQSDLQFNESLNVMRDWIFLEATQQQRKTIQKRT